MKFDPETRLSELTEQTGNMGIAAGYSVKAETKWTGASGLACEDEKVPFSTVTITRIASISKNFTAVALMQLREKGLLDLEDAIANYLPDLPEDKRKITIKQLMAHTSGIPQYQNENEIENKIQFGSLQDAMDVFIARPLLFEPGTQYFYTSYGYVILGRIVEVAAAMSFGDYMERNIFSPSGMENTGIEYSDKVYGNKSCLYHNNGRKVKEGKPNDLSNRIPGGGFYSTLEDMIRFGNALVDGKLITPESLKDMLKVQPVTYDGNKYGLGWYLYGPPPNEDLVIGHSGGQTGCTSQLMIVPRSQTVVVVLSNTSGTYPEIASFASNLISLSESEGM